MSKRIRSTVGTATTEPSGAGITEAPLQLLLEATAECIARVGIDKVSMEDIASASGLSRATLYRRFGSREAILTALLLHQARPFVEQVMRLSASATSFAERIELSTLHAVIESTRHSALKQIFSQGVSRATLEMIEPVHRELVTVSLLPALAAARECGELRAGLDLNEVVEWLLSNFLLLVAAAPWEPENLRRRIRQFILPVLVAQPQAAAASGADNPDGTGCLSAVLDRRLAEIQHSLSLLHMEMAQLRLHGA